MKILIIDDEVHCIDILSKLLKKLAPDFEIVGTASNGKEGLELIKKLQPEAVFLDIQMPVMGGIEMLENCDSLNFKLVFTTAYNEYAIKAIKLNAIDYLLKPLDKTELSECIEKLRTDPQQGIEKEQISNLKKSSGSQLQETIALSTQKGLIFINASEIMLLEADSSYTNVYLEDESKLLISKTMLHFEEILDEKKFFRPHKSYLINLKFIKQYIRGDGGEIIMKNGMNIPLSRTKKDEFLSLFDKI